MHTMIVETKTGPQAVTDLTHEKLANLIACFSTPGSFVVFDSGAVIAADEVVSMTVHPSHPGRFEVFTGGYNA